MSTGTFDVYEIEIAPPHKRRLMARLMTEAEAEAFIKIAVARRGVETHFYKAEPHSYGASNR